MKFFYLLLMSVAVVLGGIMPSSKDDRSNSWCHSSIIVPLDPLTSVETSARAVRANPESPEAHRELGSAYLSRFDSSEVAQQEFREVVRLEPTSSAGYTGLGWSNLHLNSAAMSVRVNMRTSDIDSQPRVALNLFEQALGLDPNDASAHLGRAQAYFLLDRNDDAEAACKSALASCPNSSEAWDMLGDVLVRLGRYNEAIDAYKAEIEISTNRRTQESLSPRNNRGRFDVVSLYGLVGDILFTLHRTSEAIAHYEKALAMGGDSSPFHHRLALAYYRLGEYERHESHLQALRVGCSRTGDDDGSWCHYYEDLIYRLSHYRSESDLLFRVTNLDAITQVR